MKNQFREPSVLTKSLLALVLSVAACGARDTLTETEIREALPRGLERPAVEAFFAKQSLEFAFKPRSEVDREVPQYVWSESDPEGLYVAMIRNVRKRWLLLSTEHLLIQVEIGSENTVTRVALTRKYTGL